MNPANRYPGFWHAVLLCVVFICLQGALVAPVMVLDMVFKTQLVTHPAVLGAVNLVDCAAVLLLARGIGRVALPEVFAFRRVGVAALAGVIVAMPGAVILLSEIDNLVRRLLPAPEWLVRYFHELSSQSGRRLWASVFLLVLVAPLTEELLFRGLILRGFLRRFSPGRAFLWSAMLFGATHLNPWQFVSGTALGFVFAWWYARTRSLIPSLTGHALANAAVVGHDLLWFKIPGFNAGDPFASTDLQPLWFDAVGLLFLILGLVLFRLTTRSLPAEAEPAPEAPPLLVPPVITSAPQPAALPPEPPGLP